MKPFIATILATALSAAFTSAYAVDAVTTTTVKTDTAAYRTVTEKAAADYRAAASQCNGVTGTARNLCVEEAKVARARAEVDAVAQYNNTLKGRTKARTSLANADYALAKVKCSAQTGAEKDACLNTAKSIYTASLADAKADRNVAVAATGDGTINPVTSTATRDPVKAAAVDKCAQVAGNPNTGCLVDNKDRTSAATAAGVAANRTENAAATAAQKTENLAETAVAKTKAAAATVAEKTERAVDKIADKTDRATDNLPAKTDRTMDKVGDKTERVAANTGAVVADSVITTKVKADIFKEPELKSMGIHVETEKGVVMLSGFVDSKADAEKAVRLARSVNGVSEVKSAIKVK